MAAPVLAATFSSSSATAAEPVAPSGVEDFSYPGAAKILADRGITLKSGDGRIVLADCASGTDLIQLYSRVANPSEVCFQVTDRTGYLALEIPQVYNIKGDDHTVKATLNTAGNVTSLDLAKDAWTPVGEGSSQGTTTLLELNATDGPGASSATNPTPAVGTVTVGQPGQPGSRSCTATLVSPQWVLTAASCFTDKPDDLSTVQSGMPQTPTIVTIAGRRLDVSTIVPRTDRDVAMVRVVQTVSDITPIAVATTAPTAGEDLQVLGFGRTRTGWLSAQPHNATFTTGTVTAAGLDVTPKTPADATVCKGDAGGPALRAKNGGFELAAVTSRAWQGGCLGETETRQGATEARVDDLAKWIADTRDHRSATPNEVGGNGRVRFADFDGDGKPDYWVINDDGSVNVWLNRGGDGTGPNGWLPIGKVANGVTNDRSRVRIADFDGDGKADYWVVNPDGSVNVWLNRGGDKPGANGWQLIGKVAVGTTTNPDAVRLADFDGDGKADYCVINDDGSVSVWLNHGGDISGVAGWQSIGKVTTGATTDRSRVRLADFDGDGKADYWVVNQDGSVNVWLNHGGDKPGVAGWQLLGRVATGLTTNQSLVYFTDFDGDGKADYLWNPGDGSIHGYANKGGDPSGPNGWADLGRVASGA
ncbi:FG-GAP-like repeat-containing protein [Kitasatospora sp. NBC_01250]|uniref:FG-GAP-like repeat-containing protein n=1 Tax=Kitasatospora sp. NBC_01250 TaxID=2903571 RepID=UPI002E32E1BB|nr:FG-GAP-like repeat-containing protein [Kitasatospora sp. NBC_01250]